ncbi:MAG: hypothetical protein K2N32_02275 [Clostridia bacterium]|nr:hypothetical protein [Clostridia bacterium]
MKKEFKFVCCAFILIAVALTSLCACEDDSDIFTDEFSQAVFTKLSRLVEQESYLKVYSVTGYYYDYRHYYCVRFDIYSDENGWQELDKVYEYMGTEFNVGFDEITGPELFEYYYNRYLTAKEKGKKKTYSEKEIAMYLTNAFA